MNEMEMDQTETQTSSINSIFPSPGSIQIRTRHLDEFRSVVSGLAENIPVVCFRIGNEGLRINENLSGKVLIDIFFPANKFEVFFIQDVNAQYIFALSTLDLGFVFNKIRGVDEMSLEFSVVTGAKKVPHLSLKQVGGEEQMMYENEIQIPMMEPPASLQDIMIPKTTLYDHIVVMDGLDFFKNITSVFDVLSIYEQKPVLEIKGSNSNSDGLVLERNIREAFRLRIRLGQKADPQERQQESISHAVMVRLERVMKMRKFFTSRIIIGVKSDFPLILQNEKQGPIEITIALLQVCEGEA